MSARFYFYPAASGNLVTIDTTENFSDLNETWIREARDARTYSGRQIRTPLTARLRVRFTLENFVSESRAAQFESMVSHLQRGGAVAVAANHTKAFATYAHNAPTHGDTFIRTSGNLFDVFSPGATIANGDYVAMSSPNPEHHMEYLEVDALSGSTVSLTGSVNYTYAQTPVLVRHRDFYPVLRLSADQLSRPFITHDHRISHTLDITLEEDTASLANIGRQFSGAFLRGGTGNRGFAMDTAIRSAYASRQADDGSSYQPTMPGRFGSL